MKSKWLVRLGPAEWARHARAEGVDPSLRLLGSVERGAQIGALAVDDDGDYFQVNGQYVARLNKRLIAKAVSTAQRRPASRALPTRQRPASTPIVTVRRSRVAGPALRQRATVVAAD